jgi:perosamine synthetase
MTNLQAALGLAQLEQIEKTISRKKSLGEMYQRYFKDIDLFSNPIEKREGYTNNYWVYGVVLNPNLNKSANQVIASLSEEGVGSRPFFWPMHNQPILKEYTSTDLPVSEHIAEYGLYLPSGVGTTNEEIERSANSLLEVLAR